MTKKTKIKVQDVDKILELHGKGVKQIDIAKMVGLSKQAVRYWLNKYELKKVDKK
jgi:predicted transcriptional regulator